MRSFLIIGMGKFGRKLALDLLDRGNDVMIVDRDEDTINELSPHFPNAFIGDCTNEDVLRSLGVNTILTSGQAPSCLEGIGRMKELTGAAGKDLTILAGAGINAHAVEILLAQTDLTAFHMSGKQVINSGMEYRNPAVSMGLPGLSEYELWQTDPENVRRVRALLDNAAR